MSDKELEMLIMQLIMNSGNARSLALEAVHEAKAGKLKDAEVKIDEAEQQLVTAHDIQTKLLFKEAQGEDFKVSLLMTHSQDHLMNAIGTIDLAKEMIDLWKMFKMEGTK